MTERSDHDAGPVACPFVAFEDDRDERSDQPDHRHRCYAEVRPAPRATAHQEMYCLSAGFAACPTFQDWARREAAKVRSGERPSPAGSDELAGLALGSTARQMEEVLEEEQLPLEPPEADSDLPSIEADPDRPIRNPHRNWADPPPWMDPNDVGPGGDAEPPTFLAGRAAQSSSGDEWSAGEASAAGLAGSRWLRDTPAPRPVEVDQAPSLAGDPVDRDLERSIAEDAAARDRASGGAPRSQPPARVTASPGSMPPQATPASRSSTPRDPAAPSWERPIRNEAYPTLKTRVGLPPLPRVGLAALALVVAAVVLFSVPFILRLGGTGGGSIETPTPSAAPSGSIAPTAAPAPTSQVYVIKAGDTILKIAKKFGLTSDQLLAANKQVKNPDKIKIGDEITIPVPPPSQIISGASPSP